MAAFPYYNPYQQNYYPASPQATGIVWVSGEKEASIYPVAPNNAVALWDSDAPVIYLKKADAAGKPTIQAFDLVERTAKEEPDVMKMITDMRTEIETLKNDFYKKGKSDE